MLRIAVSTSFRRYGIAMDRHSMLGRCARTNSLRSRTGVFGSRNMPDGAPLYDHPLLCRAMFFPEPDDAPAPGDRQGPLFLDHPEGFPVCAWRSWRFPDAPVLVLFHGNGESIELDIRLWRTWATSLGLDLCVVDYPGYGASGGVPTFTSCRKTGAIVLDALGASGVPGVIVMGRSMGSWVALTAVAGRSAPPIVGLVLESAIADLGQRIIDRIDDEAAGLDAAAMIDAIRHDFDLRACMAATTCPVLVLHTVQDRSVPAWHGRRLAEWAGPRLFRGVFFPKGDHNSILAENLPEYRNHLREFVAHVRAAASG